MKRTIVLLRQNSGARMVLLRLSLIFLAGCSSGSNDGANATGRFGLDKSEFIALKKAGKGRLDLQDAQAIKKIEQMKERGVAVETTTSGKKTSRPR